MAEGADLPRDSPLPARSTREPLKRTEILVLLDLVLNLAAPSLKMVRKWTLLNSDPARPGWTKGRPDHSFSLAGTPASSRLLPLQSPAPSPDALSVELALELTSAAVSLLFWNGRVMAALGPVLWRGEVQGTE